MVTSTMYASQIVALTFTIMVTLILLSMALEETFPLVKTFAQSQSEFN